jgi:Putative adhesin
VTTAIAMTPARRAILILGVPVALALIGGLAFNEVAQAGQVGFRVHLSAPARGQRASVSVDNAEATVSPGAGHRIWLRGTLRGSLTRPAFSWRSSPAGLALHSSCHIELDGSCTMNFDITVPGGMPVTVSDSSGDLIASNLRGHVTLSAGSGDLAATGLSGTISLTNGSGDIAASGLDGGRVRLSDDSGDITTSGLSGSDVGVSDSTGDIFVTGLAGTTVISKDDSGDISLTFTKVPQRVDVTDGSGDITLVLPSIPAGYQVHAHSASGDVSDTVNNRSSSRYEIIASDGSGDITISY